jgi:hypothetical protein
MTGERGKGEEWKGLKGPKESRPKTGTRVENP